MDTDNQTRGGRAGRSVGAPNYRNDILIGIVELYLPQDLEAWREVAVAYQRESMEATLRWGEDLRDKWNRKLCNRMHKPTGKPGALTDRIFRCIEMPSPATLATMATALSRKLWQIILCSMMLGMIMMVVMSRRRMKTKRWWQ
jgi:hypothetical protein